MKCVVDVHASKHGENICLQERHQEFQRRNADCHDEWQNRTRDAHSTDAAHRNDKACKNLQRNVTGKHVCEKSD